MNILMTCLQVELAAVCCKALILLILVHCLILLPFCEYVFCLVLVLW